MPSISWARNFPSRFEGTILTTTKKVRGFIACAIALLGLLERSQAATADVSHEIAVVVNGGNPVDGLSAPELRRILLGERRFWRGNVQIKLALPHAGSPERDRVLATLLGMNTSEFARHWRDKVFRGEAPDEPLSLPSAGSISRYTSETPGALTFIERKNLGRELKVLKLDGKAPGEPGYFLK